MVNLDHLDTDVPGFIRVTSGGDAHPRVGHYWRTDQQCANFTVSINDDPRADGNADPEVVAATIAFVEKNKDKLLNYWHNGQYWSKPQTDIFLETLEHL